MSHRHRQRHSGKSGLPLVVMSCDVGTSRCRYRRRCCCHHHLLPLLTLSTHQPPFCDAMYPVRQGGDRQSPSGVAPGHSSPVRHWAFRRTGRRLVHTMVPPPCSKHPTQPHTHTFPIFKSSSTPPYPHLTWSRVVSDITDARHGCHPRAAGYLP